MPLLKRCGEDRAVVSDAVDAFLRSKGYTLHRLFVREDGETWQCCTWGKDTGWAHETGKTAVEATARLVTYLGGDGPALCNRTGRLEAWAVALQANTYTLRKLFPEEEPL